MDKYTGIIVGIDGDIKSGRSFRIVLFANKNGKWEFSKQQVNEGALALSIAQNRVEIVNCEYTEDKRGNPIVKGSPASLDRFKPSKLTGKRAIVIISEIRNSTENVLGYKIATSNGQVKNVKANEVYAMCTRALMEEQDKVAPGTAVDFVPIQNAEFVKGSTDHIRSYAGKPFMVEHIEVKKAANAAPAKVNTAENEKSVSRLEEIFTKEQIKQLKEGRDAGINYKLYGNNQLLPEQMCEIKKALMAGVDPTPFADPLFKADAMQAYTIQLKYNVDISKFVNPKYGVMQILELSTAVIDGLDIGTMANPSISAEKMGKIRIELESKLWREEEVSVVDLIKEKRQTTLKPDGRPDVKPVKHSYR